MWPFPMDSECSNYSALLIDVKTFLDQMCCQNYFGCQSVQKNVGTKELIEKCKMRTSWYTFLVFMQ